MPAVPFVLFLTVPVIAALSLEFDTFVHLLILFCIVAGLSASVPERARPTATDQAEAVRPQGKNGAAQAGVAGVREA